MLEPYQQQIFKHNYSLDGSDTSLVKALQGTGLTAGLYF